MTKTNKQGVKESWEKEFDIFFDSLSWLEAWNRDSFKDFIRNELAKERVRVIEEIKTNIRLARDAQARWGEDADSGWEIIENVLSQLTDK